MAGDTAILPASGDLRCDAATADEWAVCTHFREEGLLRSSVTFPGPPSLFSPDKEDLNNSEVLLLLPPLSELHVVASGRVGFKSYPGVP